MAVVAAKATASDLASQCPIGAIDDLPASEKPVEITFWHSLPEENERLITELTDEFNASQDDVKVKLVNQTSYGDTLDEVPRRVSATATCPTSCMLEDKETQRMIDSQAVIPAQACVDADDYDTSDFLTRVTDYFTVEDTLWPMPFNVSNPVLYYNKAAVHAGRPRPRDAADHARRDHGGVAEDRRRRRGAARLGVEARPVAASSSGPRWRARSSSTTATAVTRARPR